MRVLNPTLPINEALTRKLTRSCLPTQAMSSETHPRAPTARGAKGAAAALVLFTGIHHPRKVGQPLPPLLPQMRQVPELPSRHRHCHQRSCQGAQASLRGMGRLPPTLQAFLEPYIPHMHVTIRIRPCPYKVRHALVMHMGGCMKLQRHFTVDRHLL